MNPRSTPYKEHDLGNRKISKKEAIDLMMEDPNLIKRPLVLTSKGKAVLGYKPEEYGSLG